MTVSDYYPDTSRKCWTDKLLFEVEVTTIDVYKSGADQIAWNVGSNEEQATIDQLYCFIPEYETNGNGRINEFKQGFVLTPPQGKMDPADLANFPSPAGWDVSGPTMNDVTGMTALNALLGTDMSLGSSTIVGNTGYSVPNSFKRTAADFTDSTQDIDDLTINMYTRRRRELVLTANSFSADSITYGEDTVTFSALFDKNDWTELWGTDWNNRLNPFKCYHVKNPVTLEDWIDYSDNNCLDTWGEIQKFAANTTSDLSAAKTQADSDSCTWNADPAQIDPKYSMRAEIVDVLREIPMEFEWQAATSQAFNDGVDTLSTNMNTRLTSLDTLITTLETKRGELRTIETNLLSDWEDLQQALLDWERIQANSIVETGSSTQSRVLSEANSVDTHFTNYASKWTEVTTAQGDADTRRTEILAEIATINLERYYRCDITVRSVPRVRQRKFFPIFTTIDGQQRTLSVDDQTSVQTLIATLS